MCIHFSPALPETNPCRPSPCGPNSKCRNINGLAVCSCLPNFIGSPPNCRAECVVNSQCSPDLACINQKCTSPCPDSCGINTQCKVINHSPICVCNLGFTGDPFMKCFPAPRKNLASFISLIHSYHQIMVILNLLRILNSIMALFFPKLIDVTKIVISPVQFDVTP